MAISAATVEDGTSGTPPDPASSERADDDSPPAPKASASSDEETKRLNQEWWGEQIAEIARPDSRAVPRAYGFGRRYVRRNGAERLPHGVDERDLLHDAFLRCLSGDVDPPEDEDADPEASRAGTNGARPHGGQRGQDCEFQGDTRRAFLYLCGRIPNGYKSASRTKNSRDAVSYKLARQPGDPSEFAGLWSDFDTAVEKLTPTQRKAFIEVEIEGKEVATFARENDITVEGTDTRLKRARTTLRKLLPDWDPNACGDDRGSDRSDPRGMPGPGGVV